MAASSRHPCLVALLLAATILVSGCAPLATLATSSPQAVSVTIPSGITLYVLTPVRSNLTVLAVSGAQYDTSLTRIPFGFGLGNNGVPTPAPNLVGGAEFAFTPLDLSAYSVNLSVASRGSTYALLLLGSLSGSVYRNVTSPGSFTLALTVASTAAAPSQGWNPLFGLTGIAAIGLGFTSEDGLILFSALLVSLFALGVRYSRKFLGLGLLLLLGLGLVIVGLVIESLVLGLYIASFVAVRAYFGLKRKGSNVPGETKT